MDAHEGLVPDDIMAVVGARVQTPSPPRPLLELANWWLADWQHGLYVATLPHGRRHLLIFDSDGGRVRDCLWVEAKEKWGRKATGVEVKAKIDDDEKYEEASERALESAVQRLLRAKTCTEDGMIGAGTFERHGNVLTCTLQYSQNVYLRMLLTMDVQGRLLVPLNGLQAKPASVFERQLYPLHD
jgi:hypothetical protein